MLKDVKILKIKPWQIKFSIEERVYLLHEQGDTYEPATVLYRVYTDEKGHYDLMYLCGVPGSFHYQSVYPDFRHGTAYSHLDTDKLLSWLAMRELSPEMTPQEMRFYARDGKKKQLERKLMQKLEEVERIRKELAELGD